MGVACEAPRREDTASLPLGCSQHQTPGRVQTPAHLRAPGRLAGSVALPHKPNFRGPGFLLHPPLIYLKHYFLHKLKFKGTEMCAPERDSASLAEADSTNPGMQGPSSGASAAKVCWEYAQI